MTVQHVDGTANDERFLLLALEEDDRSAVAAALSGAGLTVCLCSDMEELCRSVERGAGAALVAGWSLGPEAWRRLAEEMSGEPSWSDFPVLLLASKESGGVVNGELQGVRKAVPGAVLVPWPGPAEALASAARAALRARRTQYRLRDSLAQRQAVEEGLRDCQVRFDAVLDERVAERTVAVEQRAIQLRALASELTQTDHRQRRRLARALHDDLQQLLVAARMKLGTLRRRVQGSDLERPLEQVDQLLDQSIGESRSLSVELSPSILYDGGLVPALHWLARHVQEKYGLEVEVELSGEAEPMTEDIRVLLFQAVQELLLNVIQHAHTDSAQVRLSRASGRTLLDVIDQGAGFDLSSMEGRETGLGGFGLFSLRERLQLLGGRTEINTAPGAGTHVAITAPPDSELEEAQQIASAALGQTQGRPETQVARSKAEVERIRVLLADDHEILREGLATLLKDEPDIEVVGGAANGQMAVEMALRTRPDVVVMDVTMPLLNGIEATRRIARALPGVRIIGLSMHDEQDMASAMLEAGATDYLPKGDSSEALIDAIRHWSVTPPGAA